MMFSRLFEAWRRHCSAAPNAVTFATLIAAAALVEAIHELTEAVKARSVGP